MERFHGATAPVSRIDSTGLFGGLFAADRQAARSHGAVIHRIVSPRPLDDFTLNYEIESAWATALEIGGGDDDVATRILSPDCVPADDTDSEAGWELQRLRGALAARLGYTSVEMRDEHGTTWLCLPGCEFTIESDDAD